MGALPESGKFADEMSRLDELAEKYYIGGSKDSGSGSGSESESEPPVAISQRKIEEAVRVLLQGLGEDHEREGIRKTPLRVAKAFIEGTKGYKQKVRDIVQDALFPEDGLDNGTGFAGGSGGLVVVRDINLFSYCESCLLPFSVRCHVGYIPSGQRVVGLSKLSRVSDVFAKRLQEPQRLANEICYALQNSIQPGGVAVALQCWHIQFPEALQWNPNPRHPSKHGLQGWVCTSVHSTSGVFEQDKGSSFWDDFLALLKFRGVDMTLGSPIQSWCPARTLELHTRTRSILDGTSAMTSAVASILESLGEDPSRKELVGSPYRYVQWLINFKRLKILEPKQNGWYFSRLTLHKRIDGNGNIQDEIHSELNLSFCAQCEHHLLPFYGVVHVAYFAGEEGEVIERSSLESVVHLYGCKLQVQERFTRQIAEAVYSVVRRGVMVVVEANHICMISRGIEKVRSSTATIAVTGRFTSDNATKASFLRTISTTSASQSGRKVLQ